VLSRRLRIRTKLLLGLIAIGALVVSTAAVVISRQSIVRRSFEIHDRMLTIERFLLECRRQEKNFFLREDDASAPLFEESLRSLLSETAALRADSLEPAVAAGLADLEVAAAAYAESFRTTSGPAWFRADGQERERLENATVEAARRCHAVMDQLLGHATETLHAAVRTTQRVSLLTVMAGFGLALLVCWWLTRAIARPLEQLRSLAERVSSGDIRDMQVEFGDLEVDRLSTRESYDLARALQKMVTNLRLLVATERGLMDNYHMTIVVLVSRAVGPAAWSVIERSRTAAGFSSFSEVGPDTVDRFAAALEQEVRPLLPEDSVQLLVSAITELTG
jgi:methyl-accepting chemotaxis protein